MKLKRIVKILILLFPITLFFGSKTEASSLPEISGDNSLTVNMIYKDGDKKIGISGAEIKIRKIADIEFSPKLAIKNISQIKDLDIDWFNLTAKDSNDLAKKISARLVDAKLAGQSKITNDLGKTQFSNLANGVYLVEQVSKTGEAEKYSEIEPFFVSLPQNSVGKDGEVTWKSSVNAYPKTEIEKIKDDKPETPKEEDEPEKPKKEEEKPKDTPKTGDGFDASIYMLASALAIGSLLFVRGKSKNIK